MNDILIYDIIGADFFGAGILAKDIKEQLDELDGADVTVRVNSPGGDVFEGLTIFNLLNEHEGKVTVKVDGYAVSIASIVAMAGDEVLMAENAMMMIHNPRMFSVGDATEMRKQADILDKAKDALVTTYASATNIDASELSELMDAETWFSADESVANGFASGVTKVKAKMANLSACQWINKAPDVEPQLPKPDNNYIDGLARSAAQQSALVEITAMRKELAR